MFLSFLVAGQRCHRACNGRCWGPKEDQCQSCKSFTSDFKMVKKSRTLWNDKCMPTSECAKVCFLNLWSHDRVSLPLVFDSHSSQDLNLQPFSYQHSALTNVPHTCLKWCHHPFDVQRFSFIGLALCTCVPMLWTLVLMRAIWVQISVRVQIWLMSFFN